jgi:hypothetical protein
VQSLYNKNSVNAKLVFWYGQSQEISMWFCFQGWPGANVANTRSSQGLCQLLTSNQVLTKSLSWIWIESQFHKTDQIPMLQTSDQVYICINCWHVIKCWSNQTLMKYQYKSNWYLIREVSAKEFYLTETLSYNRKLGLIQRRKHSFLANNFF